MKLVMTLLVRDEADIIAANIDYHLRQGVDFIIATDNRSEDGTADILRGYERQGCLRYIHEADDDYSQGKWVTRMARLAHADHGASWVINNDADEFWWPASGDLKSVFASLPDDVVALKAPRFNFVAVEERGPFHSRMIYRERQSFNSFGKPLPPKLAHRAGPEVVVEQGNHKVAGLAAGRTAEPGIEILHFPVRSLEQIENKIVKGGAAYARNHELAPNTGRTWRKLYGELLTAGSLQSHFRDNCPDAGERARLLAAGELIRDVRLREFFANPAPV